MTSMNVFKTMLRLLAPISFHIAVHFLILTNQFGHIMSIEPEALLGNRFAIRQTHHVIAVLPLRP